MNPVLSRTTMIGTAIFVASVTLPLAGGHSPVEMREAAMKEVGKSTKLLGEMVKGETAFDAAAANEALTAMAAAVADFGTYFPEGTALAGENENAAAETIWTDRAGFDAAVAEFQQDIAAAVEAAPQSQDALATSFAAVAQNCKSCHEDYRVKK